MALEIKDSNFEELLSLISSAIIIILYLLFKMLAQIY